MTQATVEVKSSLYYGREVSGNFPFYGVQQGDRWCSREVYLRIERDGKQINVHANRSDFVVTGQNGVVANVDESGTVEEILSEEELEKIIKARFDVMSNMTSSIITGDIRSLIISGAPGVGKTFELEGRLKKAEAEKVVNKVTHLKGKISPLGLYITLYHHRNKGDVILFDDIDSVFGEETTLNLLKAALDSSVQRTLSWKSTTKILSDEDIPTDFDFCFLLPILMVRRDCLISLSTRVLSSRAIPLLSASTAARSGFTSTMVLRATTSRLPAKIRYSTRHRLGFHATRFM
jgi:hypothetical protein